MSDLIIQLAQDHPVLLNWLMGVYFAGMFVSHVIRVRWPNEIDRSDTVKLVAAIADACSFTFLTGAKALGRKLGN